MLISLYLFLCFCLYWSISLNPTLKWSEMTEHLRRDDANPSEDLRGSQTSDSIQNYHILPYVKYIKFLQYINILWKRNIL